MYRQGLFALVGFVTIFQTGVLSAAVLNITGSFEVTDNSSGVLPYIVVGDVFDIRFLIDDSIIDSEALSEYGIFSGAVTGVSLGKAAGNIGTWDPTEGTFASSATLNTSDSPGFFSADKMNFEIGGGGFPNGGPSYAFSKLLVYFIDPAGITIHDTGSGQTLAQQFGGSIDPNVFQNLNMAYTFIDTVGGVIPSIQGVTTLTVSEVPLPAAVWMFGCGLVGLIGLSRRKGS